MPKFAACLDVMLPLSLGDTQRFEPVLEVQTSVGRLHGLVG
jgi:hypothetical protein